MNNGATFTSMDVGQIQGFAAVETWRTGIFPQNDGMFTAITLVTSRDFKTRKAAEKWMEKKGYTPDGQRIIGHGW